MSLSILRNEKGMALVSVYVASILIMGVSSAAFGKAFHEKQQIDREVARVRSFAAAEAGIQNALAQISNNAYTGFINTNTLNVGSFQNYNGTLTVGNYSVSFSYPNQADWVVVTATATVDGDTKTLEGRVFLDSNLSKYLVYADTTTFSSGTDAQYGEPDMTDTYGDGIPDYPEYVPSNEDERAALYFTNTWNISGSGVHLYGDAHAENQIDGNASSSIHGDAYVGDYTTNSSGSVTNSGVSGGVDVGDGFDDDLDRNGNGSITSADYPDYHDLTSTGDGDAHATEDLTAISHTFYATNGNTPQYVGSTSQTRYLKFVPVSDGTATQIVEYSSSSFATQVTSYTLPSSAIVYVKGNIYVKGEIGGRVSVVSSNSIYLDGNMTYAAGQTTADATHSAAFLAKDKVFFRANDLTASGILYGENSSNSSAVFDATYNTSGQSDSGSKARLRLYGNRIMKGSTNLSYYDDRVYAYDKNLKYYRPPGIPVVPSLRTVREV
jgi:hypothetical protein